MFFIMSLELAMFYFDIIVTKYPIIFRALVTSASHLSFEIIVSRSTSSDTRPQPKHILL
jgi:hypothetical protein